MTNEKLAFEALQFFGLGDIGVFLNLWLFNFVLYFLHFHPILTTLAKHVLSWLIPLFLRSRVEGVINNEHLIILLLTNNLTSPRSLKHDRFVNTWMSLNGAISKAIIFRNNRNFRLTNPWHFLFRLIILRFQKRINSDHFVLLFLYFLVVFVNSDCDKLIFWLLLLDSFVY